MATHQHALQHAAGDIEKPVDGGIDHLVPILILHEDHHRVLTNTRIVDQHLDRILRVTRFPSLQGSIYRRRVGHIERNHLCHSAASPHLGLDFGCRFEVSPTIDQHRISRGR